MSEQKTYIGSGKIRTFDNGGSIIKWSSPIDELEKAIAIQRAQGETWININICERKEPSEKGMTHYGVLDTWKPDPNKSQQPQSNTQSNAHTSAPDLDDMDSSIPF